MGMNRLQAALDTNFGAVSPNKETHRWRGSELTFDDQFGREVFYMQAERNLNSVVKNNMTSVVGNARSTKIGTDDLLEVDSDQFIAVENNRCITVQGSQVHQVLGDINQQSLEGNQVFDTLESFESFAKHHRTVSEESLTLKVGGSTLYMRPDFVILQTPYLFLNPGDEATQQAIESGERPLTPEELAAIQREAAIQAHTQIYTDLHKEGRIANYQQLLQAGPAGRDPDIRSAAMERFDNQYRPAGWAAPEPGNAPERRLSIRSLSPKSAPGMKLLSMLCSPHRGAPERKLAFTQSDGAPHRLVAITGAAGSGKTTLLELVARHKEHVAPYARPVSSRDVLEDSGARLEIRTEWLLEDAERLETGSASRRTVSVLDLGPRQEPSPRRSSARACARAVWPQRHVGQSRSLSHGTGRRAPVWAQRVIRYLGRGGTGWR